MSNTAPFFSTWTALALPVLCACTLDVGENFQVAEVVYDEDFFYCQVEPMMFQQGCGKGDPSRGESAQGCHFNRQRLRLTDYSPLAAEQCLNDELGDLGVPQQAQQNYQSVQLQMEVDPDRSPLLNRPTSEVAHPRVIFELNSEQADVIRTWGIEVFEPMTSSFRCSRLVRLHAWLLNGAVAAWLGSAAAQSVGELDPELDTVARVTSSSSELRAGPGLSYRVIERAERGDTFFVQGREPTGFWLRVYLADGRTAYLLGDTADTMLATDAGESAPGAPGVFAPPPLATASAGLAMTGGIFEGHGYAEVKPALVLTRALSLEPYVGLVMSPSGRSLLYGGGATVNLAPDFALAPYLSLGAGGFSTLPNDDAFVLRRQTLFHARVGGGVLVSLRWRITLRLEATNTILFDASAYRNAQSFVGGLGSYF